MKEIILAAILMGAVGFIIGFAIETIGRASRRDAKRRNVEPPTITRWIEPEEHATVNWVLPYDPDDDSTKTPERGYGQDEALDAWLAWHRNYPLPSDRYNQKHRGRVNRDNLD